MRPLGARSYYRLFLSRAIRDALHFIGDHVLFAVLLLFGTYAVGVLTGTAVDAKTVTTLVLYPLAAVGLVTLVVFCGALALAPVRLARDSESALAELRKELAEVKDRLEKATAPLEGHEFKDQTLYFGEIARYLTSNNGTMIVDKVFEGCTVIGPGVFAPLGNIKMDSIAWQDTPKEAMYITVPAKTWITGALGLLNCEFRRCKFRNIAIIGTPDDKKLFEAAITYWPESS